jgi:hypothetical protein
MVDNLGPNGLSRGCKVFCSRVDLRDSPVPVAFHEERPMALAIMARSALSPSSPRANGAAPAGFGA